MQILKTILVTSSEELTDYADQWESLRRATGGTVYNNLPLTKLWLETYRDSASARVVLVENKGELIGIAPLAASQFNCLGFSLKTISLVGGIPKSLRLVTNSIMYQPDRKDALRAMLREMRCLDWSILWTENMDNSPAVQQYLGEAHSICNATNQVPNTNLTVPLNDSIDVVEGFTKNARRNFNKTLRMMEREGLNVKFRRVPSDGIDVAVDIYAKQHIERWQTKGGSSFQNPQNCDFLKKATKAVYDDGYGYAYELLIDNEIAGQMIGFRDRDKAYSYRLGMNNVFMKSSPGWHVAYHTLNDLRKNGIRQCTMGGGGQRYKYEMGAVESQLVGVSATRGIVSLLGRFSRYRPVQMLDSKFGIMKKTLSSLSINRADGGPISID